MSYFSYEGVNLLPEQEPPPYDHHCPLMGAGLNTWKALCFSRQGDSTMQDCYGGCRIKPDHTHEKPFHTRTGTREKVRMLSLKGLTATEIADELRISGTNVDSHRTRLRQSGRL